MPERDVDDWYWRIAVNFRRLGEEIAPNRPAVAARKAWEPAVDLYEVAEGVVIRAEIAGVRGDDIQLTYLPDRRSIVMRGVRAEDAALDPQRTGAFQLEIHYGEFEREIRLPDLPLDTAQIRANYRNGFLVVLIPRNDKTEVVWPK